ncbi:MAG: IS66 family transposase [Pseudomonadota bacterium]
MTNCPPDFAVELQTLRWQANYRTAMHQRAMERVEQLRRESAEKLARVREQWAGKLAQAERVSGGRMARLGARLEQAHADSQAQRELAERYRQELKESRLEAAQLREKVAKLKRGLRLRRKQAFARNKSERRLRDPRRGRRSHPRRGRPAGKQHDFSGLPLEEDPVRDLPQVPRCGACEMPYEKHGTTGCEEVEIEVRAYRRRRSRQRYRQACRCPGQPKVVAAPAPGRLIPGGILGESACAELLLDKYLYQRPTHRLLALLKTYGLDLAPSTVNDAFHELEPLFKPLYEGILERLQSNSRWQADETGWYLFLKGAEKGGHWYLWVYLTQEAVYFHIDPSRSSKVVEKILGTAAEGILNVDRYSAYKAFSKLPGCKVVLAFCWTHQRRDFLTVGQVEPELVSWAVEWLNRFDEAFALNRQRLAVLAAGREAGNEAALPAAANPAPDSDGEAKAVQPAPHSEPIAGSGAEAAQQDLEDHLAKMQQTALAELQKPDLVEPQRKVLKSLVSHWKGLTVFVEHPEVPMDNSASEREVRNPVVGRKNYRGSRSAWSATLAAMLFSIFHTLRRHDINPRLWLLGYLKACADNNGQAPADAQSWLPWNLSAQQRQALVMSRRPNDRGPPHEVLRQDIQPARDRPDPAVVGQLAA